MGRWQMPQAADGGAMAPLPRHHDGCAVAVPLPIFAVQKQGGSEGFTHRAASIRSRIRRTLASSPTKIASPIR